MIKEIDWDINKPFFVKTKLIFFRCSTNSIEKLLQIVDTICSTSGNGF
jgi:hypothetical protein